MQHINTDGKHSARVDTSCPYCLILFTCLTGQDENLVVEKVVENTDNIYVLSVYLSIYK